MKKLICVMLTVLMMISCCTACGEGTKPEFDPYKIAIVQQMYHASLDEIRLAIEARLETCAAELGYEIAVEVFNGQNDSSVLAQIGAEVAGDGFDLIIPIASLAAQYMFTSTEGSNIPIVYAAVSDPEGAGLTGYRHVTGTSDALNTAFILDMMFAADPDIQSVGLLYSLSEPNSVVPIRDAKAYLDAKGIAYLEKTGTTTDEIVAAASSMVGRVDAVFTPTDNTVMGAEGAVADILNEAGIPHYAGADSFVLSGAFATCGVNYTELGTKTAEIALDVLHKSLNDGMTAELPFHVMEGGIITVNTETAAALGLDYAVFQSMAATVTEVTTSE